MYKLTLTSIKGPVYVFSAQTIMELWRIASNLNYRSFQIHQNDTLINSINWS